MSRALWRGLLLLCLLLVASPAAAAVAEPARFEVGAAIRDVNPNEPIGAAGSTVGQVPLTTDVHDPLQTRAMVISNGSRAVAFVATDVFGQFAAVAEGADLGLQGIREAIARRVSAETKMSLRPQDVVISSSHSHASASVMGFWERPPVKYMQLLRDRQIDVVVAAARAARPAHLEYARADGAPLNALVVAQVNAYEGWIPDGLISVLRATDATTGATIATYATIPCHPTVVPGVALQPDIISADYPGATRAEMDRLLGGVSIVAPGTLGRQTTPWSQVDEGLRAAERQLDWFSTVAARLVVASLADATPIVDGRIEAVETRQETAVLNGVVLALTGAQKINPDFYAVASAGKAPWPLNRTNAPPWQDGARLWTPLTAVRIGGLLYLSQPGEPFAEIRLGLAEAIRDATEVIALSQAQDALGYFYPPSIATVIPAYAPNDHALFNVSPRFGDEVVDTDLRLARELGFTTGTVRSGLLPPSYHYERALTSGIQGLASPPVGSACGGTFTPALQAVYSPILHGAHVVGGPKPRGDRVRWDFGDGTTANAGYLYKPARGVRGLSSGGGPYIDHGYRPGRWSAEVSAVDEAGGHPAWTTAVMVHPEVQVAPRLHRTQDGLTLTAVVQGGQGTVLRTTWTRPDGERVDTAALDVPRDASGRWTVQVTDASGATARTEFRIRDAQLRDGARTCSNGPQGDVAVTGPGPRALPRLSCVSRRQLKIRVRAPRNAILRRVVVRRDGKVVRSRAARGLRTTVDLRGLRRGRYTVEVVGSTASGRLVREERTYRTCSRPA